MSNKQPLVLIGGGGHCLSCIDVIEQQGSFVIEGIIDIKEKKGSKIYDYPVIGRDEDIPEICKRISNFHIAVGQIETAQIRIKLYEIVKKAGGNLPVIISPFAYVSKRATIGEGTIVMHHALINAGARIGCNCIINSKALIEHDVCVGNHCHVSTGSILNGEAQLEDASFFGSNAVSKQGVIIPEGSFIKALTIIK